MKQFGKIYKGKNVLVTGHTGFKGSWLSLWLHELGANVIGYSLEPHTARDNFVVTGLKDKIIDIRGDIRDRQNLLEVFEMYQPEVVFHLAAQALVRYSYDEPIYTYETNVIGTINVLECIRQTSSVKVGIMVTTDKCYENKEQIWGYKENDPLGGDDPYSSSKAAVEIAIASWKKSFFNPETYNQHGKAIASVRAGNVIGGGDFSQDRIIPDCIKALENDRPITIRNPKAIRPWQHVLEPLSGYLLLGEKMLQDPITYSESWNFGPNFESIVPVWHIAKLLIKYYGKGELLDISQKNTLHEAELLNLDISKVIYKLGWKPTWDIEKAIQYTVEWYKEIPNKDKYAICLEQIKAFEREGVGKND